MPRSNPKARSWYQTAEWRHLRKVILKDRPLCVRCKLTIATVVDHKTPHKGNVELFFDINNLQPCCKSCHDSWKARQENGRVDTACDDAGYPLDKNHPWN